MFSKELFILTHQLKNRTFYSTYRKLIKNQSKNYPELKKEQEKQLREFVDFAYRNVPYYHKLFKDLKLFPRDIKRIEDLQRIPILTKKIIKRNWEDFKPTYLNKMKFFEQSTGGSTGIPLKYRLYKSDRFLSSAMLYRGWGYANYELGDRMVILGGASLNIGKKLNLVAKIRGTVRNTKKLSSFDMSEKEMGKYVDIIKSFKPKFIRGYPSAIYFFATWIKKYNLRIYSPLAIFTTAEKLYPNMRKTIEEVFNSDVYDGYGLNDGGVSAYECSEHNGLHIDTERAIMEVVEEDGKQIENGEGEIIATSLYNYAMPFIRYDTGDLGHIIDDDCDCGKPYKLLKELVGRSVDILVTPEGKNVHGWFFLYIFWEYCKGIKEYQVIQEKLDKIVIKIVPEEDFDEKQLDKIRGIVKKRSEGWNIEFKFVDKIDRTKSAKYKYIINELKYEF
ncbi:phenylacetate--CoA ligase family protein [Candidatus Bathyarchaeota archaeon]|nr:MAG: phenylacetate--CoA ligase family protein [Candidatus Bathyarchaeota archaeon]